MTQLNRTAKLVSTPTTHRGPLKTQKRPAQKRPPPCTVVQREVGFRMVGPTQFLFVINIFIFSDQYWMRLEPSVLLGSVFLRNAWNSAGCLAFFQGHLF